MQRRTDLGTARVRLTESCVTVRRLLRAVVAGRREVINRDGGAELPEGRVCSAEQPPIKAQAFTASRR